MNEKVQNHHHPLSRPTRIPLSPAHFSVDPSLRMNEKVQNHHHQLSHPTQIPPQPPHISVDPSLRMNEKVQGHLCPLRHPTPSKNEHMCFNDVVFINFVSPSSRHPEYTNCPSLLEFMNSKGDDKGKGWLRKRFVSLERKSHSHLLPQECATIYALRTILKETSPSSVFMTDIDNTLSLAFGKSIRQIKEVCKESWDSLYLRVYEAFKEIEYKQENRFNLLGNKYVGANDKLREYFIQGNSCNSPGWLLSKVSSIDPNEDLSSLLDIAWNTNAPTIDYDTTFTKAFADNVRVFFEKNDYSGKENLILYMMRQYEIEGSGWLRRRIIDNSEGIELPKNIRMQEKQVISALITFFSEKQCPFHPLDHFESLNHVPIDRNVWLDCMSKVSSSIQRYGPSSSLFINLLIMTIIS